MDTPLVQPDERNKVLLATTHCFVNVYLVIKALSMNEIETNNVNGMIAFYLW